MDLAKLARQPRPNRRRIFTPKAARALARVDVTMGHMPFYGLAYDARPGERVTWGHVYKSCAVVALEYQRYGASYAFSTCDRLYHALYALSLTRPSAFTGDGYARAKDAFDFVATMRLFLMSKGV